jgi:hypothetical protein
MAFGASAALMAPAMASPAAAAKPAVTAVSGVGEYTTWYKAMKAAKFTLKYPTATYGLKRTGKIIVDQCIVTGHLTDRVVDASYGNLVKKSFTIEEDNASGPCGNGEEGSYLGKYEVDGVAAYLYGFCGADTPYSCSSTDIELWLTWKHGADYYIAGAHDESRARLVHFAKALKNE